MPVDQTTASFADQRISQGIVLKAERVLFHWVGVPSHRDARNHAPTWNSSHVRSNILALRFRAAHGLCRNLPHRDTDDRVGLDCDSLNGPVFKSLDAGAGHGGGRVFKFQNWPRDTLGRLKAALSANFEI